MSGVKLIVVWVDGVAI